jgi:transposase-like protein
MTTYPDDLKAKLIERMLPPQNASVSALARETGIPKDTLYCWRGPFATSGRDASVG